MAQLSLFAVSVLIGILLVGQLRSQARPAELRNLSAQELSTLIETLAARNRVLSDGLAGLRAQVRDYEGAGNVGQSRLDVTSEDLRRITAFGGLAAVAGQGVQLEVDGSLDAIAVNDLIHELRNAGAEAIAIDDIRITARSVAVLGTASLEIDGVPIGRSFVIRAVGSPDGLTSALDRPGGITTLLEQSVAATIRVTARERLSVPATELDLMPSVAEPLQ